MPKDLSFEYKSLTHAESRRMQIPKHLGYTHKNTRLLWPVGRKKMPSPLLPISNGTSPERSLLVKAQTEDDPSTSILDSSQIEDEEKGISINRLLPRAASYNGTPTADDSFKNGQERRRGIGSESSLSTLPGADSPQQSFSGDVGHADADKSSVTRCSKLFTYIRVGFLWIKLVIALACYALLLMPGFIQVAFYYFFSKQIRRNIVYGDKPRNRLDLYLPKNNDGPKPVIAFITGGAWTIGYKAWGCLLGQEFSERDVIVACIDYRNYPRVTISDMINDASQGISFVCNKITEYGGDPDRIYLMGQSAGAHIGACTLLEQAIKECGEKESVSWSVSQIKAYFGLSGGYNLLNLIDHFDKRGLYRSFFLRIMEGEESLIHFSPAVVVQDPNVRPAAALLPPIVLFHGTRDYTIPSDESIYFGDALTRVGVTSDVYLYEGKAHTDVFIQDPMRGGKDKMFEDLITIIHADDLEAQEKDAVAPPRRRLLPECLLKLASLVSPF